MKKKRRSEVKNTRRFEFKNTHLLEVNNKCRFVFKHTFFCGQKPSHKRAHTHFHFFLEITNLDNSFIELEQLSLQWVFFLADIQFIIRRLFAKRHSLSKLEVFALIVLGK